MMVSFHFPLALVVACVLPLCLLASLSTSPVTIKTTLGEVTGIRKTAGGGKQVDIFYGIPFAKPPVGDLRFKAPKPAEPWEVTLDGTKKPNSCWQAIDSQFNRFRGVEMWNPNTEMSEDCLYLNVWRPSCVHDCPESKTILVWIFGGGFWSGTTTLDLYDGTQLARREDVILVSIAYRTGPFGYLYMGSDDAPGNMGMLDQVMALQWIKDNAANLGGSPNDISIFGESAGAVSVGFHLLSPLSRDLFNYAIMESASPVADWAIQELPEAKSRAVRLAESVNCTTETDEAVLICLRSAEPSVLADNQWLFTTAYFDMTFGPVVDGHFLPDYPNAMLERGDIKKTSVIAGVNENEGIYFDLYGFQQYFDLNGNGKLSKEELNAILPAILGNSTKHHEDVLNEYINDPSLSNTGIMDAISGDILFKCPVVDFAREYTRQGGHVYVYSFEHRVSTNPWPQWLGVAHGYEIEIVFGLPLAPQSNYTSVEKLLSKLVMDFWTRLAKTGNPNKNDNITWPVFTVDDEKYIIIDTYGVKVSERLRHDQCAVIAQEKVTTHHADAEFKVISA